jgi:hypothetical protein
LHKWLRYTPGNLWDKTKVWAEAKKLFKHFEDDALQKEDEW